MSTMTRIEVSIVRSTKKAHLVQDADGVQFWIQARNLKDGSISERVHQTALQNKAEFVADRQAERAAREAYFTVQVDRETEKAVGTSLAFITKTGGEVSRMIWFPKSMLRDGQAPGWMIASKVDDAKQGGLWLASRECDEKLGGCAAVRGI